MVSILKDLRKLIRSSLSSSYIARTYDLCDNKFCSRACMACMSPAVTIGAMLNLSEDGYGEDKGIGSILCTAAAMEDILMVSLYTICFSFVFSNGITKIVRKT